VGIGRRGIGNRQEGEWGQIEGELGIGGRGSWYSWEGRGSGDR